MGAIRDIKKERKKIMMRAGFSAFLDERFFIYTCAVSWVCCVIRFFRIVMLCHCQGSLVSVEIFERIPCKIRIHVYVNRGKFHTHTHTHIPGKRDFTCEFRYSLFFILVQCDPSSSSQRALSRLLFSLFSYYYFDMKFSFKLINYLVINRGTLSDLLIFPHSLP